MRLIRLSALFAFLGLAPAQTLSGLSFDGEDVVSLMWAFDGQTAGRYDFFLCAGDESTGSYVSTPSWNILYNHDANHLQL
jgi:hypothetical protein